MKHRQLAIKLHTFCHSQLGSENSAFLLMMDARKRPQFLYEDFIDSNGRYALNLSAQMRGPCDVLAQRGDWAPGSWQDPLKAIRREVVNMIEGNNMFAFHRSEVFRAFCFKVAGNERKAAKLLKLKTTTEVGDILMHYHGGERATAQQKMGQLLRKEKKTKRVVQMYTKLKEKGFIA